MNLIQIKYRSICLSINEIFLKRNKFIIFYTTIIAHAPLWIMGFFYYVNRPLFSYDIIACIFILFYNRRIGMFLIFISWVLEFISIQSNIFYFLKLTDFIYSVKFSPNINYFHIISLKEVAIISVFLIFLIFIKIISEKIYLKNMMLDRRFIIVVFLLIISDIGNGTSYAWGRDTTTISYNIAGSSITTILKNSLYDKPNKSYEIIEDNQTIIKKFDFFLWAEHNSDRSILFVVVESLGVPRSPEILSWLNKNVQSKNHNSVFFKIKYQGSTTSGELRSLCGLKGTYGSVTPVISNYCLPQRLSRIGWSTVGFHGFSKNVFDRDSWWPLIGLDKTFFVDAPEMMKLKRCGNVFRGTCDKDVLNLAGRMLETPRSLVYVLTLNTHLPVVPVDVPPALSTVCAKNGYSKAVCMHVASLGNVLKTAVNATSSLSKAPLIVLVGDHAPPFSGLNDHRAFMPDVVPGYVLVPHVSRVREHVMPKF